MINESHKNSHDDKVQVLSSIPTHDPLALDAYCERTSRQLTQMHLQYMRSNDLDVLKAMDMNLESTRIFHAYAEGALSVYAEVLSAGEGESGA